MEKPRFGNSHFCAGCPVSMKEHTGCVVESSVVITNYPLLTLPKTEPIQDIQTTKDPEV